MGEHASSNLDKYKSGNPIVQGLLSRYQDVLASLVVPLAPTSVLDVGSGEGMTAAKLHTLPLKFSYKGIDLSAGAVEEARRRNPGLDFSQGSVFELGGQTADVVICLEVIEHLEDPAKAIDALAAATERSIVVSVPWEPWFRLGNLARGKYLDRLGNHPEHIQQFSPASIAALVSTRFTNVRVKTSFPWVFVCADKP